jgi:chromosome segregation ATPase
MTVQGRLEQWQDLDFQETAVLCKDAAAEIAKLQENVNYLQIADNHHQELMAEKDDEIARLRAELDNGDETLGRCVLENEKLGAEITSLRDQLGEALVRENNLITALVPFARAAEVTDVGSDNYPDESHIVVRLGQCRVARKALAK